MNLQDEILKEHSKRQARRIADWIGSNKGRFKQLMELFLKGDFITTQRTAWILTHCADKNLNLVLPYLSPMIDRMREPGVHDAAKRNVVCILQRCDIPRQLEGKVATICFDLLVSPKEGVAVKAYAMNVLAAIAKKEPDLKNELRLVIEQQMPNGSAGFRARGKHILRQLETIN